MNLDGTDKLCDAILIKPRPLEVSEMYDPVDYLDRLENARALAADLENEPKPRRETLEPEHRYRRGAPSVQQLENEDEEGEGEPSLFTTLLNKLKGRDNG